LSPAKDKLWLVLFSVAFCMLPNQNLLPSGFFKQGHLRLFLILNFMELRKISGGFLANMCAIGGFFKDIRSN
jgi:hypothetical protein